MVREYVLSGWCRYARIYYTQGALRLPKAAFCNFHSESRMESVYDLTVC